MKFSDYLIDWLSNLTDQVFLVYGAANADMVDSIANHPTLKYVCTQHEQGAGFAAEGVSKTSDQIGVAMATSGPGGQNLLTSMANCYYDSVPAIFITGQVKSRFMVEQKAGKEKLRQLGFQETPIVEMARPVTKLAISLRPDDLTEYTSKTSRGKGLHAIFDDIMIALRTGRPGPVLLDIPIDVQQKEVSNHVLFSDPKTWARVFPHDGRLQFSTDLLGKLMYAKRPAILIGGGCHNVNKDMLYSILRRLGIPCFPTWNALDIITDDFELYGGRVGTFGGKGRNIAFSDADLVLSLGARISGRLTGGAPEKMWPACAIENRFMVDIDPANLDEANMETPFGNVLQYDLDHFLQLLYSLITTTDPVLLDRSEWRENVIKLRDRFDPVLPEHFDENHKSIHPYASMRILSQEMENDDILVADCGGNVVTINHSFEFKNGQRYITNNGNSPMGFAMCGAIGAAIANPDKRVVCVIGDGGMTMNSQELQTIKHYDIKNLKIIVFNNGVYGITKAFQNINFNGKHEACGPKGYSPPDFIKLAEAYELKTHNITFNLPKMNWGFWDGKYSYLQRQINAFLSNDATLCNLDLTDEKLSAPEFWPRIVGWQTQIWDMTPRLPDYEMRELVNFNPDFSHRENKNVR
jgi:acetolactate synthase-1/2/3 large subunit